MLGILLLLIAIHLMFKVARKRPADDLTEAELIAIGRALNNLTKGGN